MCFSATASFISGTALCVIGIATLKQTKAPAEVPFALFPLPSSKWYCTGSSCLAASYCPGLGLFLKRLVSIIGQSFLFLTIAELVHIKSLV